MSSFGTHRPFRHFAAFALVLVALTLSAACGGGDENGAEPTAGEPTATVVEGTRTPDMTPTVSEAGEPPIFWRTADEFESLRAGEPYKIRFRITSGYDEETLRIVASCLRCDGPRGPGPIEFDALRAEPQGEEPPGSYYPFSLELPQPGTWEVTVAAGDDEATITVQVVSAETPTGWGF